MSIGTSDAGLVPRIIDCLAGAGIDYAILHGADRVLTATVVSDLDVVVRLRPERVMEALSDSLDALFLEPIMEWPYDLGRTLTVFLSSADGRDAMQLDMLCDPMGLGRYAVRSNRILDRSVISDGLNVISAVDECVYLTMKRATKGQQAEVERLAIEAQEFEPSQLDDAIRSVFTSYGRRRVRSVLAGSDEAIKIRPVRKVLTLIRLLRRLIRPTGFWIHVDDADLAAGVHGRFGSYLPNSMLARSTFLVSDALALIARMRPGIVVTHGRRPLFRPDGHVSASSLDLANRQVVDCMSARTSARLGRA